MSSDQLFSRAIRMAKPDVYPVPGAPPEARTRPSLARRRLEALVFVNLGPTNEGLPTSARKEGPAFQAMKRLAIDQKLGVIFKLAGIDGWLRSTAKVVWLSHSGTAGGLQLIDMSAESRRVVDMWFSAREQAGHAVAGSGSQTAPPNPVAAPAPADFGLDSYQVVLPVEAIEIAPGPAQRSQPLAQVAVQANARATAPKIEANWGTGVAVPQLRGSAGALEAARASAPRKSFKIERKTAKSLALVLWALLGMFFLGGIIIAEFRSGLPVRSAAAEPAPLAVPPATATASLPPLDASADSSVAPPGKPVIAPEPAPGAPETAVQDTRKSTKLAKPASLVAPGAPARATSQPQGIRPAASQQIARAAEPSAAIRPASAHDRRLPSLQRRLQHRLWRPGGACESSFGTAPGHRCARGACRKGIGAVNSPARESGNPNRVRRDYRRPLSFDSRPCRTKCPRIAPGGVQHRNAGLRSGAGLPAGGAAPAGRWHGEASHCPRSGWPSRDGHRYGRPHTTSERCFTSRSAVALPANAAGSTPVEAEEDVTLIFRIAAPSHPGN